MKTNSISQDSLNNQTLCVESDTLKVALCYSGCHRRGGVERVLLEAARHLRTRCSVSVVVQSCSEPQELPLGVNLVRLGGLDLPLGLGLPATRYRTHRYLSGNPQDVVAGFGVQAPEGSVVWMQSVHAAWWEHSRMRRRGGTRLLQSWNPFHKVVLAMEDNLLRKRQYRRLIALTSAVREDLLRFYQVAPSDVDILPNGFHPEEFNPELRSLYRRAMREHLGIPDSSWVVLFVANEWERKGLLPLMEAVAALGDSDVHIVAAGRLPPRYILGRASRLGLRGRVHVVGSTGRINRWFGMADVFALPTSYEAWGMVIVEALASGLPVLTSRTAGASVAVSEGRSGYLLDEPGSCEEVEHGLRRLREGVAWSGQLIAASVMEYAWEKILTCYEAVLRSVV